MNFPTTDVECRQNTHSHDTFVHVQRFNGQHGSGLRIVVPPKRFRHPSVMSQMLPQLSRDQGSLQQLRSWLSMNPTRDGGRVNKFSVNTLGSWHRRRSRGIRGSLADQALGRRAPRTHRRRDLQRNAAGHMHQ